MFTGIVEATAPVLNLVRNGKVMNCRMERPAPFDDLNSGCSIACHGICLTVKEFDAGSFTVEMMNETLVKTNAHTWRTGTLLNLERALKIGGRLDGHWVLGHVDTAVALTKSILKNDTRYLSFALPEQFRPLAVPQGSIAINGVSLTIAELSGTQFTVALIGYTLTHTTLSKLGIGDMVNVEFDILGKYVHHQGNSPNGKITMDWLYEQGF